MSGGFHKKLELNTTELLRMRHESNLNNIDIAEALGVSVTTINRRIGRCPKEITGYMSFTDYQKKYQLGRFNPSYDKTTGRVKKRTKKSHSNSKAKPITPNVVPSLPKYTPNVEKEVYKIDMDKYLGITYNPLSIEANYKSKQITIEQDGLGVFIPYDKVFDVLQFLTWFTREKLPTNSEENNA